MNSSCCIGLIDSETLFLLLVTVLLIRYAPPAPKSGVINDYFFGITDTLDLLMED
jgi:hypothetical protein